MNDGQVVFDITGSHTSLDSSLDRATDSIAKKTAKWTALAQTAVDGLLNLTSKAIDGFGDLLKNGVSYNARMQDYMTNFGTLLGSTEEAEKKITELKQYAVKTPFAMSDLAQATQTMLSFGLTSEETSMHLKRLGDISMGDAQKLQSLTLAFSQVSSTGKLMGTDLLQMINAGFNPLQVLAEKTGVSIGDLKAVMAGDKTSDDFNFRMLEAQKEVAELGVNASEGAIMLAKIGEEGEISADMVAAAMRIATSEGGLFFNALENASANFNAQWSTMQDNLSTLTGNVFADVFDSLATDVMPTVNRWLSEMNDAYEKDGFAGLAGAAGGIFDEIGLLAKNTGEAVLTNLLTGLTGDPQKAEEIKAVISDLFSAAGESLGTIKDAGLDALAWVKDNGELVGKAASLAAAGFALFTLAGSPMALVMTGLATAIAALTTDWSTFEQKHPALVAAFEKVTGLDFSIVTASMQVFKDGFYQLGGTLASALPSVKSAIDGGLQWLNDHGLSLGTVLMIAALGFGALTVAGSPLATALAAIAGAISLFGTNWVEFEKAHPAFVAQFEKLTGLDFTKVAAGMESFKSTVWQLGGTLGEMWPVAKSAIDNALQWLNDHGVTLSTAAAMIALGFGAIAIAGNPLALALSGIAAAVALFGTNWATFETDHPEFVAKFEQLTGLDFTPVANGLSTFKGAVSSVGTALGEMWPIAKSAIDNALLWLNDHGVTLGTAAAMIALGFGAIVLAGNPLALAFSGIAAAIALFGTNWATFEADHPEFVAKFEELTGLDFTPVANGLSTFKGAVSKVGDALSSMWPIAKSAIDNALQWLNDNGVSLSQAAILMALGFGALMIASNPLALALAAVAGAIGLFGTNWETFETDHPEFVAKFEEITGLDFSTVTTSLSSLKRNLSAFWDDVAKPLLSWLMDNGEAVEVILLALGAAMVAMGNPLAGFMLIAKVIVTNWDDIKTTVTNAYNAVSTFLTQTVPEAWNTFVEGIQSLWKSCVCDPIDNAAKSVLDFFGIQLPEDWSLTQTIADAWGNVWDAIVKATEAADEFLNTPIETQWTDDKVRAAYQYVAAMESYMNGSDMSESDEYTAWALADQAYARLEELLGAEDAAAFRTTYEEDNGRSVYDDEGRLHIPAEWLPGMSEQQAAQLGMDALPNIAEGLFSHWSDEAKALAKTYIQRTQAGDEKGASEAAKALSFEVSPESLKSFVQLVEELSKEGVEIPANWFSSTEANLQSELDRMTLHAAVSGYLNMEDGKDGSPQTGQAHAAGGVFTAAARLLDRSGNLHTVGESGAEAVLPLDELWRRLGLMLDSAFSMQMAQLPTAILPVPSASAAPAPMPAAQDSPDYEALAEDLAARFAAAIDGMAVEMDRHKVGKILTPEVSRNINDEAIKRKWTT